MSEVIPDAAVDNIRMTIIEFLEARIAEDEATLDAVPVAAKQSDDFDFGGTDDYLRFTMGYGRAMAECAAKRAALKLWEPPENFQDYDREGGFYNGGVEDVLLCLAAVYKDHPEYQQEWAL